MNQMIIRRGGLNPVSFYIYYDQQGSFGPTRRVRKLSHQTGNR